LKIEKNSLSLLPFGALVAVLPVLAALSCRREVPQKPREAFSRKFPSATEISWDRESDGGWEAEFKMDGVPYSAEFLEDGTWQATEHEIREKDLPKEVILTLKNEFREYTIEESEISETMDGIFYEIELDGKHSDLEVLIDGSGKIIKRDREDQEDEDDD